MPYNVRYAVYGALAGGNKEHPRAITVAPAILNALNHQGSIVKINNSMMGIDPSPGDTKHFGAFVGNYYYACQEGQTIDFSKAGGQPIGGTVPSTNGLVVDFAVYGALTGGYSNRAAAFDVTALLQAELNITGGTAVCGSALFSDPSPNNQKHFAAVVSGPRGTDYYACAEGQPIDFNSPN
jgi:hypothetical protein